MVLFRWKKITENDEKCVRLRKVDMREVMMYEADSNMDGGMTWHNWFLKSFFVAAECHDIHGGKLQPFELLMEHLF